MKDLKIQIELQALITEREGMVAFNQYRMGVGLGIGYDENSFEELADKMRALAKKINEPDCRPGDIVYVPGEIPQSKIVPTVKMTTWTTQLKCSSCDRVLVGYSIDHQLTNEELSMPCYIEMDKCGTKTAHGSCSGTLRILNSLNALQCDRCNLAPEDKSKISGDICRAVTSDGHGIDRCQGVLGKG